MEHCRACGAELREGAIFCSQCGTPVEQSLFCRQCGAKLLTGDKFCFACGAAVQQAKPVTPAEPSEPAKRRPGRPRKHPDAQPKAKTILHSKVYPDVRGMYNMYGGGPILSVSDRALVFCGIYGNLYRVDRKRNTLFRSEMGNLVALAQTEDGILALEQDTAARQAVLHTLDDRLQTLSTRPLLDITPEAGQGDDYGYALNARWAVAMNWSQMEDEVLGDNAAWDLIIRIADLESGEVREQRIEKPEVEGKRILELANHLLIDKNNLYLSGEIAGQDADGDLERHSVWLRFDLESQQFSVLWEQTGLRHSGEPRFFDFQHQIMWTYPREMEMKRRGWEEQVRNRKDDLRPLVPRKIAPNSPILGTVPVRWFPDRSFSWSYFDGVNACVYYAEHYFSFHSIKYIGEDTLVSPNWCKSGHGQADKTVIWDDWVIADLDADYRYTVYRDSPYERPQTGEDDILNVERVTPSDMKAK